MIAERIAKLKAHRMYHLRMYCLHGQGPRFWVRELRMLDGQAQARGYYSGDRIVHERDYKVRILTERELWSLEQQAIGLDEMTERPGSGLRGRRA